MTDSNYDGLCGIYANFASSDLRLRCNYHIGHAGTCSFEKYRRQLMIFGGITRSECIERAMKGGTGAIAARAILGIPDDCVCRPIFDDNRKLVDFIFAANCEAHNKK